MSSADKGKFVDRKRYRSRDDELSEVASEHGPEVAAMLARMIEDETWTDGRAEKAKVRRTDGARDHRGKLKRGAAIEVPSAGHVAATNTRGLDQDDPR